MTAQEFHRQILKNSRGYVLSRRKRDVSSFPDFSRCRTRYGWSYLTWTIGQHIECIFALFVFIDYIFTSSSSGGVNIGMYYLLPFFVTED